MHDPQSICFEIPNPFIRHDWVHPGYRPPLVTVWHVDPQTDGTDDSCDWFGGRLTKAERDMLERLAQQEHDAFFGFDMIGIKDADPLTVICATWRSVRWGLLKKSDIPFRDFQRILLLASNPGDNLRYYAASVQYKPLDLEQLFLLVGRQVKRLQRPWWRHPRWHVHHWKIQIHPWERLMRTLKPQG